MTEYDWQARAEIAERAAQRWQTEVSRLRDAIRVELTHGGIVDRVAHETAILGALSEEGSDVRRSAERLDADKIAFRQRMRAALDNAATSDQGRS